MFDPIQVQAARHHVHATRINGVRCGIIRLLQIIAAVHLGAGVFELSILALANAGGLLLSYLLARLVTLRHVRAYLIVPALVANLLLLGLCLVDSLQAFIVLTAAHLLLDACSLPAMGLIQRCIYERCERGTYLGKLRALFMALGLCAALLFTELMHLLPSVHVLLLPLAGLLGLWSCIHYWHMSRVVYGLVPAAQSLQRKNDDPFKNNKYMSFLGLVSIAEIGHLMLLPILPTYLIEQGIGIRGMAWFFVIIPGLCGMLSFSWWGRRIDQWGSVRVRAIGAGLYAVEPLLLIYSDMLQSVSGLDVWFFIGLAAFIRGLGLGAVVLTWSIAPLNFARQDSCARYIGCNAIITGMRNMLAPLLAGLLFINLPYAAQFMISACALLCASAALWFLVDVDQRQMGAGQELAQRSMARS